MTALGTALQAAAQELASDDDFDWQSTLEGLDADERHEVITELSGTSKRSTKAYRNQARNIQRYVDGTRHPTRMLLRLLSAFRVTQQATGADGPVMVEFEGTVLVSTDERGRSFSVELTADNMDGVLKALAAGHDEDAAELFESALGGAYVRGMAVTDVDYLGLSWA